MPHTIHKSESENLSRIRDILFGEDLQSIEQKLDTTKDENLALVEKLKIDIENRLKNVEQLQQQKFNDVDAIQKKSIELQNDSLADIKQEIVNLKSSIISNIEQFDNKITNLENTINKTINQLKEDYTIKITDLNKNKLDKNTLADMLAELAENIKNNS